MDEFIHKFKLSTRAWREFNDYYIQKFQTLSTIELQKFLSLPFEFQMGVFIDFFKFNGLELDIQSLDLVLIKASAIENFEILEKTIGHYS